MSTTIIKILVAIGVVAIISALGLVIYNQEKIKNQQTSIQNSVVAQQQLIDGIVKSGSQYATAADLAKFASDSDINLKVIQANMKTLGDQLTAVNVVTAVSSGQVASGLPSTNTGLSNPAPPPNLTIPCVNGTATCPNQDPYGYQKAQQNFALNEDFGTLQVPFSTVGFSAFNKDPWSVNTPTRTYSADTVVGTDENGRQTYYNKFNVVVNGKTYEIPIKNATTEQQVPTAKFSFFNPRLFLGTSGGVNITHVKGEFGPDVSLGIASYGQTKINPDWSILEVGAQYDTVNKNGAVVITPIAFNIGKRLLAPLIQNTYIGPTLSVGFDGSVSAGGGLRVGF